MDPVAGKSGEEKQRAVVASQVLSHRRKKFGVQVHSSMFIENERILVTFF